MRDIIRSTVDFIRSALELISGVLGLLNNTKGPSVDSITKLLLSMEQKIDEDLDYLFTSLSEEFSQLAGDASYQELKLMFFGLKMILMMKNYKEFEEELKKNKII